jgi:type I restriction-modification system DNA methylase subunit
MQTPQTKAFIKKLEEREFSKTLPQKFLDFLELAFCAYAKPMAEPEKADALEARYMQIVGTYRDKDAVRAYPELIAMIAKEVPHGDFLGTVAAEIGALNARQGQFFTPYEVSRMMAEMTMGDHEASIEAKGYLTVQEPAVGSGGMILALADAMQRRGYDPSSQLFVSAIDVSATCYWMTYLQLTFSGIPAEVIHGNSLSLETFDSVWTHATVPFFGKHGDIFAAPTPKKPEPSIVAPALPAAVEMRQLALF